MFQSFDLADNRDTVSGRIEALRAEMTAEGIDGYIVPRADEHQGEYVPPSAERLFWLTAFSGSAGNALILARSAHIFVDGRYTLQVREQTDTAVVTPQDSVSLPLSRWLGENALSGWNIGFDPWLLPVGEASAIRKALEKRGASLVPVHGNLVDRIWSDRPRPPLEPVTIHHHSFAGVTAREKLRDLATATAKEGADAAVLSDPSSIAWAFNIRGHDVPHTPLPLGFAILHAEGGHELFMDKRKMGIETEAYLTQLCRIQPPSAFADALEELGKAGKRVLLDRTTAGEAIRLAVAENGGSVVEGADPARLPRAIKNATEIAGSRRAHLIDGAAMAAFLCWLDAQQPDTLDEITVARRLEAVRAANGEKSQMPLRDISFDTISGSGPNGAIVHYRVSERSNRRFRTGELYLVDSGGQYDCGTTDITRTVAIGLPTAEMRDRFTRVLKGMIAISVARFPAGTRGMDIDVLARNALWQAGFDYAHGTGHGVGSYLSVHEGPQNISKRGAEPLQPGMILSNEPGYYKTGAYGIRIENLVLVTPAEDLGGDIEMMGFETLTLCPIDRRLVEPSLMTPSEISWLDAYHARVRAEISPLVDAETRLWLEEATAPVG